MIDPLHFAIFCFSCLILFVIYLLLPRGLRVAYFGAYPKRYAWSARSRTAKRRSTPSQQNYSNPYTQNNFNNQHNNNNNYRGDEEEVVTFDNSSSYSNNNNNHNNKLLSEPNDEIVISAAMQQLRDPGVLIVAHGSRGRPKTVRLQLSTQAITWRTETRSSSSKNKKLGKLHQVPLSHIMYVDVGKQTTALRRVENAGVPESLCFSLLTKEGSLDLEANSPRERDALVGCFSLVLDEVHAAQNWREGFLSSRPSDMPSSFDDFENEADQQPFNAVGGGADNDDNDDDDMMGVI